ncbi:ABC transporter substrate-binding protein [Streptosporangium roseum]|uniref:Extracellular solute-binding protein, family 3 n=1 Tax=Streptosporangium roseum (strain ATCC 12428 / DSM 43021 / JCM 3005 / KCTC 9067 / NCIMB 10171 / NRRL 2505 / NI 9100) TaxID=479432 RepID=D2ARH1_STRRD|nr:ABC transporter substrate-binding protein [Streptosporangium roseum]ACZ90311.1 extracellular solute-binding protein, family 3 [Streptosporangium roseum DSM 43021]
MKRPLKISSAVALTAGLVALAGCGGQETTATAQGGSSFGECEVTENPPTHKLSTMKEGVLTVAASLPFPAGYRGNTLESVDGGYMYCLDAEIANRAGLKKINLVNASFEALVTAKSSNFDFAVWDIYDTPERRKVVDFSTPYNTYGTGVLVKSGSSLAASTIKDATVGVLAGSVQLKYVQETLKPKDFRVFSSNDDLFNAVLAGQIDAALNDTATVMPRAANSGGKLKVVGAYPVGGDVAALFPKGSANVQVVDRILADMKKDGTLDAIMDKWLNPILGGDPGKLPDWAA